MSPKTNLVALPYEVRTQIFREYFKVDGGYIYNGESEKLTTADCQPIDFSLRYTCRSIADDTRRMPLAVNTITFSTLYRQDWRQQAGGLDTIVSLQFQLQIIMMLRFARLRRITPDILSQLARKFPQHVQSIEDIAQEEVQSAARGEMGWSMRRLDWFDLSDKYSTQSILSRPFGAYVYWDYSGGRSSFLGAIDYTLRLLAEKHPVEFASLVDEASPGWTGSHSPHEFLRHTFDPWAIPSLSEVIAKGNSFNANRYRFWEWLEDWHSDPSQNGTGDRYREKLYFSAAAVAIRFLTRLPVHHCLCIRNITLNEDRLAVGQPQSHARGLIPFCQENSRLRVERRVNLWQNILLKRDMPFPKDVWRLVEGASYPQQEYYVPGMNTVYSFEIDNQLLPWLADALEVLDEGMPVGSFSFVLDGEPDLDLSSDLFDKVIHRQVAWRKSLTECIARGLFPHKMSKEDYSMNAFRLVDDHFPEVIDSLMSGTSTIQSNFNLGQPWDFENLIVKHQEPSRMDWMEMVESIEPEVFPFPTSAGPVKLRLEMFEKQRQCDYLASSFRMTKREKKRLSIVRRRRVAILAAEKAAGIAGSDMDSDSDLDIIETGMRTLFEDVLEVPE
ncbi:hypothetical protein BKA56DRAFT_487231 [Ilyonectria sp. MPI-CAGE-AT-0026]|nr:hypothetical protein BKA56DRAFT_487231 [Ilyonectria sp. MPI-CAGE-AT-0026]